MGETHDTTVVAGAGQAMTNAHRGGRFCLTATYLLLMLVAKSSFLFFAVLELPFLVSGTTGAPPTSTPDPSSTLDPSTTSEEPSTSSTPTYTSTYAPFVPGACDEATAKKCGLFDVSTGCSNVDPATFGQTLPHGHPLYQCSCRTPGWIWDWSAGTCVSALDKVQYRRLPQAYLPRSSSVYTVDENGQMMLRSERIPSDGWSDGVTSKGTAMGSVFPRSPEPWIENATAVEEAYAEVSMMRKGVLEFAIPTEDMKLNCAALTYADWGRVMLLWKRKKAMAGNARARKRSLVTAEKHPETEKIKKERKKLLLEWGSSREDVFSSSAGAIEGPAAPAQQLATSLVEGRGSGGTGSSRNDYGAEGELSLWRGSAGDVGAASGYLAQESPERQLAPTNGPNGSTNRPDHYLEIHCADLTGVWDSNDQNYSPPPGGLRFIQHENSCLAVHPSQLFFMRSNYTKGPTKRVTFTQLYDDPPYLNGTVTTFDSTNPNEGTEITWDQKISGAAGGAAEAGGQHIVWTRRSPPAGSSYKLQVRLTTVESDHDKRRRDCSSYEGGCMSLEEELTKELVYLTTTTTTTTTTSTTTTSTTTTTTTTTKYSMYKRESGSWNYPESYAYCDTGHYVVGGGCRASGGDAAISSSNPYISGATQGWRCSKHSSCGDQGTVYAWVMCSETIVTHTQSWSISDWGNGGACPSYAPVLLGGGCQVDGQGYQSASWPLLATSSMSQGTAYPHGAGGTEPTWQCGGFGTGKTVWALCADAKFKPYVQQLWVIGNDWTTLACPSAAPYPISGGCWADPYPHKFEASTFWVNNNGPDGWECGGHGGAKTMSLLCLDAQLHDVNYFGGATHADYRDPTTNTQTVCPINKCLFIRSVFGRWLQIRDDGSVGPTSQAQEVNEPELWECFYFRQQSSNGCCDANGNDKFFLFNPAHSRPPRSVGVFTGLWCEIGTEVRIKSFHNRFLHMSPTYSSSDHSPRMYLPDSPTGDDSHVFYITNCAHGKVCFRSVPHKAYLMASDQPDDPIRRSERTTISNWFDWERFEIVPSPTLNAGPNYSNKTCIRSVQHNYFLKDDNSETDQNRRDKSATGYCSDWESWDIVDRYDESIHRCRWFTTTTTTTTTDKGTRKHIHK
eukprot:g2684.t1